MAPGPATSPMGCESLLNHSPVGGRFCGRCASTTGRVDVIGCCGPCGGGAGPVFSGEVAPPPPEAPFSGSTSRELWGVTSTEPAAAGDSDADSAFPEGAGVG